MESPPRLRMKLGVMAKYWSPGAVKTRLGKSIGMQRAASIHRVFCLHLARTLGDAADERTFVITPSEQESAFASVVDWDLEHQSDGDLGSRMRAWFSASGAGEQARVLIGADCPLVSKQTVDEAAVLLNQNDVVLGPARDGGYYLIALHVPWRPPYASLMEQIPWSEESVFELTCSRAEEAGLKVGVLGEMEDVDTILELENLREQLVETEGPLADLAASLDQILAGDD